MNQAKSIKAMNDSELLETLRAALERADEQRQELKLTEAVVTDVEAEIRERLKASGKWEAGCGMKIPGLSVNVQQKYNAAYDPDKWDSIVKWAASEGYTHIVQRRLSAGPLRELEIGGVALPPGLRVEPYLDMGIRRS